MFSLRRKAEMAADQSSDTAVYTDESGRSSAFLQAPHFQTQNLGDQPNALQGQCTGLQLPECQQLVADLR